MILSKQIFHFSESAQKNCNLSLLAYLALYDKPSLSFTATIFPTMIPQALRMLENMSRTIQKEKNKADLDFQFLDNKSRREHVRQIEYKEVYDFELGLEHVTESRILLLTNLKSNHHGNYSFSFAEKRAIESYLCNEIKKLSTLVDLDSFRLKYEDSHSLNARRHYYFDKFCNFFSRNTKLLRNNIIMNTQ